MLYAKCEAPVPEQDWVALVQSIAAGDQLALHALYERAHRIVFTLIMRITANRETAEELTIDVFHDVWRRASRYDAANGTVLGWIMNQARSRAIDRLRFESRKKRSDGGDVPPRAEVAADPHDVLELREQGESLRAALAALTPDERAGDRNDVLRRAHACRSCGAAESAARHHQDAHSFGTAQAAARAGRGSGEAMSTFQTNRCEQSEVTCAYAAAGAAGERACRGRSPYRLVPGLPARAGEPAPGGRQLRRLAHRCAASDDIAAGAPGASYRRGDRETAGAAAGAHWSEPEWEQVAPGIECKLLATDTERHRVSMLVRLAPGASYPAHTHAGVEELHLLDGELWIDERKLFPGDYNYGAPGAGDDRVWSETGCTCVLVTSTNDTLR